jgi:RIO kinase 1
MAATLEQLVEDGIVDEVLARLKSGKEADVWLVRHGDKTLAAKIYKDRTFRSFKNDSGYKEGRAVRNSRTQRAMDKGSKFGQAAAEEAWKSAESDALHKLFAAGVRVPEPVLFYDGVLVMNLATDGEGNVAPRLIDAFIPEELAAGLYEDLRAQAIKMLTCELIHGDLSPYNVLLAAEGPTIIDFPQVVSAAHNSTAESYFKRDLENLREFFCSFDATLQARTQYDAAEIWHAYVKRDLAVDFVPSGRAPPEVRRQERGPRPGATPPQVRGHGQPHGQQQGQRPPQQGHKPNPQPPQQQQGRAQHAPQQHGRTQHAPQQQGRAQHAPQEQGRNQHAPQQQGRDQQAPQQQRQGPPAQHGRPQGHQGRHPRGPGPQQGQQHAHGAQQAPPQQPPAPAASSAPAAPPSPPVQQHPRQGQQRHHPGTAHPHGATHPQSGPRAPGGHPAGPRHGAPQQGGPRHGAPQQGGPQGANRNGNRPARPFPPRGPPAPVVERVVRPPLGSPSGQGTPAQVASRPPPGRPRGE